MIYYAKDYGIEPQKEVGKEINALLKKLKEVKEDKTLIFEKGVYYIDTDSCFQKKLYITNTIGDKEYKKEETPHLQKIAIYLEGVDNLTVKGGGSVFYIDGKCTSVVLENCNNVKIEDMIIDVKNPALFEFSVKAVKRHSVIFSLNKSCDYTEENGEYYFIGKDYKEKFFDKDTFYAPARVREKDNDTIERAFHPFKKALSLKETDHYEFKGTYFSTKCFSVGDRFYIFDTRRKNVGIFLNLCKNITLKNIKQHFNYSLALVCQKTENINVDSVDFSPCKESGKLMSSLADFIQVSMCKGKVSVTNSNFCGACDDVINVHGTHLVIENVENNKLTLKHIHPQTHGFDPYYIGDEIEYVDRFTLLPKGKGKILSSRLVDEYTVEITVDNSKGAQKGMAVEDVTLCPDLYFANNTLRRITTRGILVTTRGKVLIEENSFKSFGMAVILLSDDAKGWYESGPCKDVTVRNNVFENCRDYYVSVLPENGKNKDAIHKNITIEANTFKSKDGKGIFLKCAENVRIKGNKSDKKEQVKTDRCVNVESDM